MKISKKEMEDRIESSTDPFSETNYDDEEEMTELDDYPTTVQSKLIPSYTAMAIQGESMVLGISSLSGRSWQGRFEVFSMPSSSTLGEPIESDNQELTKSVPVDASISDVNFTPDGRQALAGLDDGSVLLISLTTPPANEDENGWNGNSDPVKIRCCEHDYPLVRTLVKMSGQSGNADSGSEPSWGRLAVTMDIDSIVKLWDLEEMISLRSWRAHPSGSCVMGPDISLAKDEYLALTCGGRGQVAWWDFRSISTKPVNLLTEEFSNITGVTCVSCIDSNLFCVGTIDGKVLLYDLRQMKSSLSTQIVSPNKNIIRLYNYEDSYLGTITSSCEVAVLSIDSSLSVHYRSGPGAHTDCPSALAFKKWSKDSPPSLYSCGIDAKLMYHDLEHQPFQMVLPRDCLLS